MAIPKELEYQNEDDFVQRFLIPLLQKLGFSVVANYHGKSEFGKDLIFAEVDRFGNVRYHALQAKYQPSVSLNDSHDLVRDCEQAYSTPFKHPQTGADGRISTFYAVNAGSISDQAKEHYFNSLRPKYGDNALVLQAKDLLVLDRWATASQRNSVVDLLSGLLIEINYNESEVIESITDTLKAASAASTVWPTIRFRADATSAYLRQPFMADQIGSRTVLDYWHQAMSFNKAFDIIAFANWKMSQKKPVFDSAIKHIVGIRHSGDTLRENIKSILESLSPMSLSEQADAECEEE